MGDQPEDLYTNSTNGAEPANWTDPAPQAPAPFDAPSSYAAEHPPAYGSAGSEPSYEAPAPAGDGAYENAYGADDSLSRWSAASEAERGATPAAVLDNPWTRSPLAPVSPVYDAPTAPNLAITPLKERERSVLAEPFPRSWMLMIAGGVALALIVAFLIQALVVRGDWAESALVAGYTAFGLAIFAIVIAGMRFAVGRRAPIFYALAGLLLVVLLGTGGGSLALAHQLHLLQAQSFEASGQWNQAATEYALYGERAPHAPNLGRVYLRWGQDLAQKQAWSDAASHLSAALAANPSDADLAAQVNTALYRTFVGWMGADAAHVPYPLAIEVFTTVEKQHAADATQAHAAAATAYLALGKQQIASKTCVNAVPTYQTLAKGYADRPEGQVAAAALSEPQDVVGQFTNLPTGKPIPVARLSKTANPAARSFSSEYTTTIDPATGIFTFAKIKQGNYNLSAKRDLGYKIDFSYFHGESGDLYSIDVGPLCTRDLGPIDYIKGAGA
jgi:tetratricopeptide (TPR) repeat protein